MGKCIIPCVSLYLKEQGLFQVAFSIFVRDLTKEIILACSSLYQCKCNWVSFPWFSYPFLESPDADTAMEIATSEQHVSEAIYDCVICGQSGPSTEDRPTGLVVLLQASSGMNM